LQVVRIILEVLSAVFSVWMTAMLIYQLVLGCFGFKRKAKDYRDHEPESRFLVLVPAHNEERVVKDIIENLQHMEYPKELYDFFIIADNCTDRTADVARQMGAKVIETKKSKPTSPTGKPIALKKALKIIGNYQDKYDILMIFDADNLIDPNMFLEVNSQYIDKNKPEMIQCYLGSKNKKGPVAWFYYMCFTTSNRFVQLARTRRGLNCGIGGTGYAVDTKFLFERGGWTTMSLTEDFEIQIEATLKGKRILWNHNVRVYDEKPTDIKASLRQRIRWAQGQWFVALKNTPNVFRAIKEKTISAREALSVMMYMYALFANIFVVFQSILAIVFNLLNIWEPAAQPAYLIIPQILLFVYSFIVLFYAADEMDNYVRPSLRTLPLMLYSTAINLVLAVIAQTVGLFLCKKQNTWVKTEHNINRLDCMDSLYEGENYLPEYDEELEIEKLEA
jgi:Glycosyltransferases, probably involved in cell wall biogenesis